MVLLAPAAAPPPTRPGDDRDIKNERTPIPGTERKNSRRRVVVAAAADKMSLADFLLLGPVVCLALLAGSCLGAL